MDSTPAAAAAPAETKTPSPIIRMIEELYARRDKIKTLMVASIDADNAAEVNWSNPPNASGMAHLWRMMNVKLDRYYARGMYPPATSAGPVAGVRGNERTAELPRKVRRQLEQAAAKVKKAAVKKGTQQARALDLIKPVAK